MVPDSLSAISEDHPVLHASLGSADSNDPLCERGGHGSSRIHTRPQLWCHGNRGFLGVQRKSAKAADRSLRQCFLVDGMMCFSSSCHFPWKHSRDQKGIIATSLRHFSSDNRGVFRPRPLYPRSCWHAACWWTLGIHIGTGWLVFGVPGFQYNQMNNFCHIVYLNVIKQERSSN